MRIQPTCLLALLVATACGNASAGVLFSEDFEGVDPLASFTFLNSGGDTASVVSGTGQVNANASGGGTSFSFLVPNVTVSADNDFTVEFDAQVLQEGGFDDVTFAFGDLSAISGVNQFRAVINENIISSDVLHAVDGTLIQDFGTIVDDTFFSAVFEYDADTEAATFDINGVEVFSIASNANLSAITSFQFGFGTLNDTAQFDNIVITQAIPEPGSLVLMGGLGLAGVGVRRRRR